MTMPNPAQTTTPNGAPPAQGQPAPVPLNPFVRAAYEHVEPIALDRSTTIGASTLLGLVDVPAFGYARSLVLYVQATGGTGTAAVYQEDAPWSSIEEVVLSDVNGAPIVGPISGYELYLIHKYGGYAGAPDPTRNPAYVAPTTAGNFAFMLRIPIEISSRDGLGSLPNQNSSSTYKLRVTQAALIGTYSTNPTGIPTLRVRAWLEAWSQPGGADLQGRPNAQTPPALGTTQFWSKQIFTISSGQNTVRLSRVGNLIRSHILVFRTTAPARSSANMPDPISLFLDSKLLVNQAQAFQPMYAAERQVSATLDTGVTIWDRCHDFDGLLGGEMRDQYLATTQASRLEFQGSFASAGTLTVLTNDIAPAGDIYLG
jgi:hypothetical protein